MRDRIVVRGEAALRCLVMQLDEAVRTISKTTPFTQVFELTGAVEEDTPDAQLTVRSLECRIAADHSLSCTVNADALVLLRRSHTLHCITDFYLPGVLLKTREDSASLYSSPEPQPFSAESDESIQTAAHISHVICADAVCCGVRAAEKGLQISASMQVLCLDDEQRLCSVQRVLPLTFTGIEAGTCLRPSLSVRAQPVGERGIDADRYSGGRVRARDTADAAPSVLGRADSTAGGHGRDAARAPYRGGNTAVGHCKGLRKHTGGDLRGRTTCRLTRQLFRTPCCSFRCGSERR